MLIGQDSQILMSAYHTSKHFKDAHHHHILQQKHTRLTYLGYSFNKSVLSFPSFNWHHLFFMWFYNIYSKTHNVVYNVHVCATMLRGL